MSDSGDRRSVGTRVLLLGDRDTADRRADLEADASRKHCRVIDVFGFEEGEASSAGDLTEVDAVVAALGRAIAGRMDVWVPFPGPDFVQEQHLRRMSMVLQRHGLNLRLTRGLVPAPTADGGMNEIDFALRREVRTVDALDQAALAAGGAEQLSREIEKALMAARGPQKARRAPDGSEHGRHPRPPVLPSPAATWPERQDQLQRYVCWLVDGCGVAQAAAARVLNSAGQRTPTGRQWQAGTVAKLRNGKYGAQRRPGEFRPDAVAG